MAKASVIDAVEIPSSFTDVLYLTNQDQMQSGLKKLFKEKKLSWFLLPIDGFAKILHRLELVGTVLIDGSDIDHSQELKLGRIIETLEMENIGVILLNSRLDLPVESFTLQGSKSSFSLTDSAEAINSVDEIWTRVSVNLAYRKKSSGIVVKPAGPPKQMRRPYINKLEDQLNNTRALVDNLAEQLRLAGLVQRDFLPGHFPNTDKVKWAAIYMPAEWVSGDIYDIVRLDDDHIGFYIADAVGHSMPAALLTIFIKQSFVMRRTVGNDYTIFSPADVVKNLNLKMAAQKLSGYQFATCSYCLLNTKTLQMTYARAGHPYPVLIRPGQEPKQLETRGSLLGIFEQAQYLQQIVQLEPGDKVLVYSDGAEPFIGKFDDLKGFQFTQEFYDMKDLPLSEMFNELNSLLKSKEISPSEFDDITAVAFEIL
ncbi:MAG: hypothetical protein E4H40_00980 [Candidatus Brocadiia bacterium]|nr:MAG: hypothetical protein E4H40_00980 [Candidatus Brocadiia bacterium]